ncbi:MAG: RrF2 family transcriptional regulator [Phycisphaeraceae bacterium]
MIDRARDEQATPPKPSGRNCPMMYSTTCAYAIRAMCRLAVIRPEGYVRVQEICDGSDLPAYFVAKIFRDLVREGLLTSAKGRGGGFALARRPNQIKLYDIVEAVDGVKQYTRCVVGLAKCDDKQPCPQHEQFKPVRQQILSYLGSTTLDQMSEALAKKLELVGTTLPLTTEGK